MLVPEFLAEILIEATAQTERNTPQKEIDRKLNKVYEINMQLDALSERLGLLPKAVNPQHVFDQMERLSLQKQSIEDELELVKTKVSNENSVVAIQDFEVFRSAIKDLLTTENDPKVKTSIIQKLVEKIVINGEEVEIHFFVGENHYKRELEFLGSRPFSRIEMPEKRRTNPLPVFHGNLETSKFLNLKPKNLYVDGSNSLTNGRGYRGRTCDIHLVRVTLYQLS